MVDTYQNLPGLVDPIVFSVGFFSLRWYAVAYLAAFATVYLLLRYRISHGESEGLIADFQTADKVLNSILDWMLYSIVGLMIGARMGYVLFYNPGYYFQNPLAIIWPYDLSSGAWTGIFGMSYFGGALGLVLAGWIFARRSKLDFWRWADFIIPAVPAGYFFGRIGNFLNGELYGRATERAWGMYFPADPLLTLRHPSQLYEAFFEGAVLFGILWAWRNRVRFPGELLALYFFGYGLFRFGIEFFREPDPGSALFFGLFTLGQLFSLVFMALSVALYGALWKRKKVV